MKDTSCRITAASPSHATLHLYYVDAEVKIACKARILHAIDVLKQLPSITVTRERANGVLTSLTAA